MFNKVRNALDGKKTYIVSASLVLFAVFGVVSGQMTTDQAIALVLNGLGLGALRSGVSKVQ